MARGCFKNYENLIAGSSGERGCQPAKIHSILRKSDNVLLVSLEDIARYGGITSYINNSTRIRNIEQLLWHSQFLEEKCAFVFFF